MTQPAWLDYEQLVASIYADLEENAVVIHDDKIQGSESGGERQIDVSIRTSIAGHDVLIIVQAKDHERPADISVVGEFLSVIRDVRAAKGVLICSGGFTDRAIAYAKSVNVDVCTAHDAQTRKWAIGLTIPLLWVEPSGDVTLQMDLRPDKPQPEQISLAANCSTWLTSIDGGQSTMSLGQLLSDAWNGSNQITNPKRLNTISVTRPNLQLRLGDDYWCPVQSLEFSFPCAGWKGVFTFSQCRGILNKATGRLHAKVGLSSHDIPLQRRDDWVLLDNLEEEWSALSDVIRIQQGVAPESFTWATMDFSFIPAKPKRAPRGVRSAGRKRRK